MQSIFVQKAETVKTMMQAKNLMVLLVVAAGVSLGQEAKPEWTYSGKDGPKGWGSLNPEYQTCKLGHTQSPIDIKGAKKAALPAIQFDYKPATLNIVNNGHSIQVNYPEGSWITVGDKKYQLKQFHFHHPSEEHVNGKPYDMVVHLVHADADGKLGVVAVLLKKGSANPMIQKIWENLPKDEGKAAEVAGVEVDPSALLPATTGYYTFSGSLTTPPCSEEVTWFVLKTPVEVSAEEVAAFAKVYPHNARPIQPTNGREIRESE
jgi:carbonic anhydrase